MIRRFIFILCLVQVSHCLIDILKPHVISGLGVSFKGHNGNFLSVMYHDGAFYIEASKPNKDPYCIFDIHVVDDDKNIIALKNRATGKFATRYYINGINHILAVSNEVNTYSKFVVYDYNGKLVLRGDNGYFACLWYHNGRMDFRFAINYINEWAKFDVYHGSITPVKEEIIKIEYDPISLESSDVIAALASSQEVLNDLPSESITKEVSFSKSITTSQTTGWQRSWGIKTGIELSVEASAGIPLVAEVKTKVSFTMEVSYNKQDYQSNTKTASRTYTEKATVKVPPKSKVRINFFVREGQDVTIPFKATVRRTSDNGKHEFVENGTWKGSMVFSTYTHAEEVVNSYPMCGIGINKTHTVFYYHGPMFGGEGDYP